MLPHSRTAPRKLPALKMLVLTLLLGAALPGCTRAGGPLDDGLYLRTHLSSSMFLWIEFIYISGDRIDWNARGGVDPFDFAAAEKDDAKNLGRFKINGDQLEVAWGGGQPAQKLHLEFQQGKVSAINAGGIVKADPYPKGGLDAGFEGNIGPNDALSGVPRRATLTFTKDSKCNLFASGTVMYGNKVLEKKPDYNRPGTYELSGNTLTIHYADGKTERHTVLPFNFGTDAAHPKISDEAMIYDATRLTRVR